MLEVENRTKFCAQLFPTWNLEGYEVAVLVVKASFRLNPMGDVTIAEEQVPVQFSDEFNGIPGESSVRYESDLALFKPQADLVVNGTAYAPSGRKVKSLVVGVRVGSIHKQLLVMGNRVWRRGFVGFCPTSPEPFDEMPLLYERAFGGTDTSRTDPERQATDHRNPVGRGFHTRSKGIKGTSLPNIEGITRPIRRWKDKPAPAGFAFIAKNWQPRARYSGTYDETWRANEMPFLPRDFDYRFFQAASEGMTCPYPQGGESVVLEHLTRDGHLAFSLPRVQIPVVYHHDRGRGEIHPVVDTILIEPDASRVVLTLRSQIPCHANALRLRKVVVGEMSGAEKRAYLAGKRYWGGQL